ncbi:hypothetical protein NDU88_007586 [Pleurodeles waltl]|uniref:Uncharacterized protein n=1 Tax=Pleurodeles waltl TaxID=8319 RepID=A0AAV7QL24_PLEWA|nr:hypothetical protein NDU88_007586 [Pleurodeles waltl]
MLSRFRVECVEKQKAPIGSSGCTLTGAKSKFQADRDGALLGYRPQEAAVKSLPLHLGGHSDPGGWWPPGPPTTGAPPTGWRCSHEHSDRGGSAAFRSGKSAGSRRLTAARGNPSWRRSVLRRHEDSDPPTAILFMAGKPP